MKSVSVDRVVGTVTTLTPRKEASDYPEYRGSSVLIRNAELTVFDFVIEMRDSNGNVTATVPVQFRGRIIRGIVRNGDCVRIDLPWKRGQTLHPAQFVNLTTGSLITASTHPDDSWSGREMFAFVGTYFVALVGLVAAMALEGENRETQNVESFMTAMTIARTTLILCLMWLLYVVVYVTVVMSRPRTDQQRIRLYRHLDAATHFILDRWKILGIITLVGLYVLVEIVNALYRSVPNP